MPRIRILVAMVATPTAFSRAAFHATPISIQADGVDGAESFSHVVISPETDSCLAMALSCGKGKRALSGTWTVWKASKTESANTCQRSQIGQDWPEEK
jgi:hypothetical protein